MSEPKAQYAMEIAIASDTQIRKPQPYYEIKSSKDPWESFRAAGRNRTSDAPVLRISKRAREDEEEHRCAPRMTLDEPSTALHADLSTSCDPNDLEFTNPPWQESVKFHIHVLT